jgi:hypothetical protein
MRSDQGGYIKEEYSIFFFSFKRVRVYVRRVIEESDLEMYIWKNLMKKLTKIMKNLHMYLKYLVMLKS